MDLNLWVHRVGIMRTSGEHCGGDSVSWSQISCHFNGIVEASRCHHGSIMFVYLLAAIIWVSTHNRLVTCGGADLALVWFCVQTLLQVHLSVVHLDYLGLSLIHI